MSLHKEGNTMKTVFSLTAAAMMALSGS
ncbi:kinase inhibitor, partial [Salmonella enterica]|nr:kinase inhibitor [Salmonella enterica]EDX8202935.1 kinase inhibitor [Salmonella enterica subsp. enterica serovar Paratyphi A]